MITNSSPTPSTNVDDLTESNDEFHLYETKRRTMARDIVDVRIAGKIYREWN